MKKQPSVIPTKAGRSFDERIKKVEERFTLVERNAKNLSAQLNEANAELNRLQGEYRLLMDLKAEAEKESQVKEILSPSKSSEPK